MNSKLVIIAKDKPLALNDDFSISLELKNPVFNDLEMFSYPVSLPMEGNRHCLKNLDDPQSDIHPIDYEHMPVQIIADGVPFVSGTAVVQEEEEVSDSLSLNVNTGKQSFRALISDLECRDIPIPAEDRPSLMIGEKIGNVHVKVNYRYHARISYNGKKDDDDVYSDHSDTVETTFEPQALGFSYPATCYTANSGQYANNSGKTKVYKDNNKVTIPSVKTSYINVSDAYGENKRYSGAPPARFCNARVCYKHYDIDSQGKTSSNVVQAKDSADLYEDKSPYWVLDANRPQSGICFYVLYFLDCLFKYLEVQFDKDALMAVEDFRHLCFFTTSCRYDAVLLHGSESNPYYRSIEAINKWLSSRGCGGQFEFEAPEAKQVQSFYVDGELKEVGGDITSIKLKTIVDSKQVSANVMAMYANSENFPNTSVSNVLEALSNAFGIRFHYDYEQRKVTAYLIRDVFRKQKQTPRTFHAEVLSVMPVSEKITGVRMRYSEEVDAKEQRKYVKDSNRGVNTDYDTDYNYTEYPKERTVYRENLYKDIFRNLSNGDRNVYVDLTTGNAYRVKVDGDANSLNDLRPTLFEVGQWKGVEYGDCSKANEDFIHDINIDFQPITFNDVNYRRELLLASGNITGTYNGKKYRITNINKSDLQPVLAVYIDEDMEHEFVEQRIRNTVSSSWADFYLTEVLKLTESYDPSKTDDGNSPLQSYDWGTAIAVMRGGGTDLTTQTYSPNYDGFGNSKWRTVSGQYALASDTMDLWGNEFDYNGSAAGIGDGERFSLKIRAYKQPEWADKPLCVERVRNRGLFDTFMSEMAYFLLHRKKLRIRCMVSVAQVVDIQNHWKEWWVVDGHKCLINSVNATISVQDGIGEVELEVYSI